MKPNVLLVILDSVRARNMGLYGHLASTTPFLEELSSSAIVYTNARSPSIGSRPSHASIFTGYHAAETGISGDRKLRPGSTIWEELLDEGYATAVFSDNPFLRSNRYGFIHGFETVKTRPEDYVDVPFQEGLDPRGDEGSSTPIAGIVDALRSDTPVRSLLNGASLILSRKYPALGRRFGLHHDTSASTYVRAFQDWLERRDGPWGACLNLMDAHYPYKPAREFDNWGSPVLHELQGAWGESGYSKSEFQAGNRPWWQLRAFEALYDGSIRQLDAALERIVRDLQSMDEFEETLIVITSDHGEAFGERSYFDPGHRLVAHGPDGGIHETRAHVPLIVKFPGEETARRVDAPASLTEFPNVVRALQDDSAAPEEFVPDGPVVVSLDAGYETEASAVYEECQEGVLMQTVFGSDEKSVVVRDPQTRYVESDKAPAARAMQRSFEDKGISESQEPEDVDRATRDHLENLGYVS